MISQKDKIVLNAMEMFKSYGTQSVSMDDLCKELSISKKTLYQMFKDKKDLVLQAVRMSNSMKKMELTKLFETLDCPIEITIELAKYLNKDLKDSSKTLVYDLQKYYPGCFKELMHFKNSFVHEKLVENMDSGKKMKLIKEEMDSEVITSFYLALHDEIIAPTQKDQILIKFEVRVATMLDYHLYGICTAAGIERFEKYKKDKDLWH